MKDNIEKIGEYENEMEILSEQIDRLSNSASREWLGSLIDEAVNELYEVTEKRNVLARKVLGIPKK